MLSTRSDSFLKQFPPETHDWSGKVSFTFSYPERGWIQFGIFATKYVQNVVINCSNVYDPFNGLANWLKAIAENNLPAEYNIDEEGKLKTLRATPVDDDEFIFEVLRTFYHNDKGEKQPNYIYAKVKRKQFLVAFLRTWDDFLAHQSENSVKLFS